MSVAAGHGPRLRAASSPPAPRPRFGVTPTSSAPISATSPSTPPPRFRRNEARPCPSLLRRRGPEKTPPHERVRYPHRACSRRQTARAGLPCCEPRDSPPATAWCRCFRASTWKCAPARSSPCSDPTELARPPPCSPSVAGCVPGRARCGGWGGPPRAAWPCGPAKASASWWRSAPSSVPSRRGTTCAWPAGPPSGRWSFSRLRDLWKRRAGLLSGGEQQILGLAAARPASRSSSSSTRCRWAWRPSSSSGY